MAAKNPMGIDITDEARAELDKFCKDNNLSRRGVLSKLVEWFAHQDLTTKSLLLELVDQRDYATVASIVLRRMTGEKVEEAAETESQPSSLRGKKKTGRGLSKQAPKDQAQAEEPSRQER